MCKKLNVYTFIISNSVGKGWAWDLGQMFWLSSKI